MAQSKFPRLFLFPALFSLAASIPLIPLAGCGGGSKPVSVAVAAAASNVDGGDTTTLTATVTNDKNSGGVTWSVSGGGTL